MSLPDHKTRIVATIGPASRSEATLRALVDAGMDVARLNLSHGEPAGHAEVIATLRRVADAAGRRVAILADLPGPKLRIGRFASEPVELRPGEPFTLSANEETGDVRRVSVSFRSLPEVVHPGDRLSLADGTVQLQVERVRGTDVACTVVVGGELRSRKGLNLPGIDLGVRAFTEHDRALLAFALDHGVDAVSQSFVEGAADVEAVRQAASARGRQPFVVAKIERARALERLDEILDAADGVMIARGDLGVEVAIERIAVIQKDIMRRANRRGRPVITATQLLESMTTNRIPTRAEATDVANAILDGTDCVMLSGESAIGRFPVESVAMLGRIAAATEPTRRRPPVRELFEGVDLAAQVRPEHLAALGLEAAFAYAEPAAVFVPTRSGASARRISALRLPVWTVAVSPDPRTCQQLAFSYGVVPLHEPDDPESWNDFVKAFVSRHQLPGRLAFLTQGPSRKHPDTNHRFEIVAL
jgi:pyruvate kinase